MSAFDPKRTFTLSSSLLAPISARIGPRVIQDEDRPPLKLAQLAAQALALGIGCRRHQYVFRLPHLLVVRPPRWGRG